MDWKWGGGRAGAWRYGDEWWRTKSVATRKKERGALEWLGGLAPRSANARERTDKRYMLENSRVTFRSRTPRRRVERGIQLS
jgi:hypothetical protein